MFGDHAIAGSEEFSAGGEFGSAKAPVGVARQLFVAFVGRIDRQEKSGRIARVNDHWKPQFTAKGPEGIELPIVDLNQAALRVPVAEPKLFEKFYADNSVLCGSSQLFATGSYKTWLIAGPGFRFFSVTIANEIDMGEDQESVSVLLPNERLMVAFFSEFGIEADADSDLMLIHRLDKGIEGRLVPLESESEVGMDIDHGKPGVPEWGGLGLEIGAWREFRNRQFFLCCRPVGNRKTRGQSDQKSRSDCQPFHDYWPVSIFLGRTGFIDFTGIAGRAIWTVE